MKTKTYYKIILLIIIIISLLIVVTLLYNTYYLGDYVIQRQWISSVDEITNITRCDNCLWIEFYEGCDRYSTYYFESEHTLNPRLDKGKIVNINFKEINGKTYIRGITNAIKYRYKS